MDDDYDGDQDSQDAGGNDGDDDAAAHIMRGGYLKGQR